MQEEKEQKNRRDKREERRSQSRQRVYEAYCAARKVDPYPQEHNQFGLHLAGFVVKMWEEEKAKATMKVTVAAVMSKYHLKNESAQQKMSLIVKKVLEVAGNTSKRPISKQKKALTMETLMEIGKKVKERVKEEKEALRWTRDWTMVLLMYYGTLRNGEVVRLTTSDVTAGPLSSKDKTEVVKLHIRKSKTDNAKKKKDMQPGRSVLIAKNEKEEVCAVTWMVRYLGMRKLSRSDRLFQSIKEEKGLSAATPGHVVKRLAALVGIEATEVAGHSMRRGGATDRVQIH